MVTATRLAHPQPVSRTVVVVALLGLCWSPLVSRHADPAGIYYVTPWVLWMTAACLVIAALVGGVLGLAVAYVALWGWLAGYESGLWTAVYFAAGALCLSQIRDVPTAWIRWGLVGSCFLSLTVSWVGQWPSATFQNTAAQGAMVAAVLPLMPLWGLPLAACGLLWSQSYLAWLAAGIGLSVAYPRFWWAFPGVALAACLVYLGWGLKDWSSVDERWQVWQMGLADLREHPVLGYGPGSWSNRFAGRPVGGGVYWAAHNEVLQWVYETGMAGAALLVVWVGQSLTRVRMAPPMWRGAAAAVLVLSLGLQVFHYPTLAPVMVLVLGGALGEPI